MDKYYITNSHVFVIAEFSGQLSLPKGTVIKDSGYDMLHTIQNEISFPRVFFKMCHSQFDLASNEEIKNAYIEQYQSKIALYQNMIDDLNKNGFVRKR